MTTEERARFEVLLEDLQRQIKGVGDGVNAQGERLDRFERVVEGRFDQLDARLDRLEVRVDVLTVTVNDTQQRVSRIEGHLELNGARSTKKPKRSAVPKRKKR